ncbi:hypothetical protein TM48_02957 [Mycobacterium shottsii]|uniref:Uncharacterized protein n=1 Tax=Mycobacterium shottsii TaxID=133549 RepID=A0A7I7LG63_9MYCO|nr:hypothetical protein TM48_02957 [Mycobacterium shottsii]BBX58627.1 hypothetical protein MSHO_39720 [Mycobacterium shottsii]
MPAAREASAASGDLAERAVQAPTGLPRLVLATVVETVAAAEPAGLAVMAARAARSDSWAVGVPAGLVVRAGPAAPRGMAVMGPWVHS